jgi:ribosomal protein S12 methylthiotransferase
MRRERDGAAVRRVIQRLRERIPGVAIRTAFITGFPGETDADFAELLEFVRTARFERVGVFRYSREEGTAAAALDAQVAAPIKRRRHGILMRAQAEVAAAVNRRLVGTEQAVLVCGTDDRGRLYGRLATQAPEIDGVVYLRGAAPVGAIAPAHVTRSSTYDLHADLVPSAVPRLSRPDSEISAAL